MFQDACRRRQAFGVTFAPGGQLGRARKLPPFRPKSLNLGKRRRLIRPANILSIGMFDFVDATGRIVSFIKVSPRVDRVAHQRSIRSMRPSRRAAARGRDLVVRQARATPGLRAASLPDHSTRVRPTVWAVIAVTALAGFFIYFAIRLVLATEVSPRGDFGVYYRAGQDMVARKPLYYLDRGIEETFKSAPAHALAVAAIQWLPAKLARLLWFLVDLSLLGVIYAVGFRILYPDGRWTAYRGWLMLATFGITLGYVINQFQSGQPTTAWVALSMLTYYWAAQGKCRSPFA
jgi:hypothetical protein